MYLLPVHVEISETRGFGLANFAIERLQFIMSLTDVPPKFTWVVKGFLTFLTFMLSFSIHVIPSGVNISKVLCAKYSATLHTGKFQIGVLALRVFFQRLLIPKDFSTNITHLFFVVLVNMLNVAIQGFLVL